MPALPRPHALRAASSAAACAAALALSAASATAQAPRAQTGVVMGQVVESVSRRPIAGVTVRVSTADGPAVTDAHGEFVLRRVEVGTQVAVVGKLGYQAAVQRWEVQPDTLQMLVSLAADTLRLQGITVQVDRLERRLRAAGVSARSFKAEDLDLSTSRSAAAFVIDRLGLSPTACGSLGGSGGPNGAFTLAAGGSAGCFWIRGGPAKMCVVIDEVPSTDGLAELDTYRPQDIYRIDVFAGGRFVEAYTTWFMAASARRPWVPMPAETAMLAYCHG
jgi:hypothetical protein